ncbi:hypothetical protein BKA67DRAFT_674710 [Truncatella angustata]|uniref:FAD-binding FR-type domain-containing protein n=1 Tax=Truncatella angustata TaxID=152316 RepID=A0A9P8UV76_9PEZI|nr:uncharacterized protein BKA67DRAFT_674710 [Truncatella angustata]KAH6658620.1 hypothetical protein BKA67DRAFT_674710 [Truncatella angustata]
MESTQWYAAILGGIISLMLFSLLHIKFTSNAGSWLHLLFLQHLRYRYIFVQRRWFNLTRLQAVLLAMYIAGNISALSLSYPSHRGIEANKRDLEQRAAILALTNFCILYYSGSTHQLANWFKIDRDLYAAVHRWVGRVAALEAILHVVVVLMLRPRAGSIILSGVVSIATTACSIVFYLKWALNLKWMAWSMQNLKRLSCFRLPDFLASLAMPDWHTIFALGALSSTFWHIITLPASSTVTKVAIVIISSLWLMLTIFRLGRILFYSTSAKVLDVWPRQGTIRIRAHVPRRIPISPGAYIYVFCRRSAFVFDVSRGQPIYVIPDGEGKDWIERGAESFTFLVPRNPHSWILERLQKGQGLLIDGPYSDNPHPENYENIFLAARGAGIISALTVAMFITARKKHDAEKRAQTQVPSGWNRNAPAIGMDSSAHKPSVHKDDRPKSLFRDSTRRIDLYWSLDENTQEEWVADHIKKLQILDKEHPIVYICCFYPSRNGIPGFSTVVPSEYVHCYYNTKSGAELIVEKLEEGETFAFSGEAQIISCGGDDFRNLIRNSALRMLSRRHHVQLSEFSMRSAYESFPPNVTNLPVHGRSDEEHQGFI